MKNAMNITGNKPESSHPKTNSAFKTDDISSNLLDLEDGEKKRAKNASSSKTSNTTKSYPATSDTDDVSSNLSSLKDENNAQSESSVGSNTFVDELLNLCDNIPDIIPKAAFSNEKVKYSYQEENSDNPIVIRHIEWGVKTPPKVTNTCALDSVMFGLYILIRNNMLRTTVDHPLITAALKMMDGGDYDGARHLTYGSSSHVWEDKTIYKNYKKGMETNGYGSLSRYYECYQPSFIGRNVSKKCTTCGKERLVWNR